MPFVVLIPTEDRERVKGYRKAAALGRAADAQLRGYLDALLINAGVDPSGETPLKVTDDEVIVLSHDDPTSHS